MTIQRPMKVLLGCGAAVALAFAVTVETLPAQWGYYGGYARPGLNIQWPGGGLSISPGYRDYGYYGGYSPYSTYYPNYSPNYGYPAYGYRAYYPSYSQGYYVQPRHYRRGFDYDNDFDFDFDD